MRRSLGQHFLFDQNILKKIIYCSRITADDTVVEIGAGNGTLTRLLAASAKKVIAIELDKKLIGRLKESLSIYPNVEIVTADAMKFPYETIKGRFKVVANIPYYITTPLLFRLLEFKEKIPSMTLLLQKEVAQRIVATPGSKDYGVLSITVQLYTKPVLKFIIPKGAFSPPPKIDSAVVYFEVSPVTLFKIKDEAFFLKVVRTAFSQRRKVIANSLKIFGNVKEALQKAGINPKVRPDALSIEDYVRVSSGLRIGEMVKFKM